MRVLLGAFVVIAACSSSGENGAQAPSTTPQPAHDAGASPKPPTPIPTIGGVPTLSDENPDPHVVEVHLTATRAQAPIDGKLIDVLAFNGTVPGPLLQARAGDRLIVHFKNELGEPTTVHWHGLRVPVAMDGSPRVMTPVANGETFTYDMIAPDAGSFWYHPHVHTNDQLERGLYGPIAIHGNDEPVYDRERELMLDDVLLDTSGNIAAESLGGLTALSGRYGKLMLTNGRNAATARETATKGEVERWRIVNTANARRMNLLVEGARARLIGTDGGLLPSPLPLPSPLVLPVGGRYDLEIAYDQPGAARLVSFLPGAAAPDDRTTMLEVGVTDSANSPREVAFPPVTPAVPERAPTQSFTMSFDYLQTGAGAEWRINGEAHLMTPMLSVPQGTTLKLKLENNTVGVEHPFHLHGQFFRVLDAAWPGLRDTVQVPASGPIEIVAYLDNPGRWMAHCHILEHAEVGMMAEIDVLAPGAGMSDAH
ncbi:MAG: multicopper oxidase family protein [Myxococcales bacterium]|nr:multicopper oxidase family protein [Myxococcales bacterium]